MNSLPPTAAGIPRPVSPMQLENQASNPQAKLEFPRSSMVDSTPQDEEPKASSLPKKPRKKSAKSQNARAGSAGSPVQVDTNGEPAYRLSRVQKIVKMNDQAQISREAVFVMALAAEHITRRLTRAGCDVAQNAQRQDLFLSDVATAVQASTSLSFLAEVIPQTIPLSTARSRRLTKDITPCPPDTTQAMVSRLQDQLRHSARPITAYTTTASKVGSVGGVGIPIAAIIPPTSGGAPAPVRNYSPREAAAVAKSKAGQSGSNGRSFVANAAGMPVGPIGPMMPLPPGFDYRSLAGMPPPPPGMAYHHLDPEAYRNGIRWAPVQAQAQPQPGGVSDAQGQGQGQGQEGMMQLPTGMWTDPSGQLVMPPPPPHSQMYQQALPPPPTHVTQQSAASNSRPARRAPRQRKQNDSSAPSQPQPQPQSQPSPPTAPSPNLVPAAIAPGTNPATATAGPSASPSQPESGSAPGSPFHPGQLQGRTIYSAGAGANSAFAAADPPPPPNVPKTNGTPKKGKRTSTKGRGSTLKKPWGRDEEEEEGDSMDLNP